MSERRYWSVSNVAAVRRESWPPSSADGQLLRDDSD